MKKKEIFFCLQKDEEKEKKPKYCVCLITVAQHKPQHYIYKFIVFSSYPKKQTHTQQFTKIIKTKCITNVPIVLLYFDKDILHLNKIKTN